jgi:hypothetical protein
MTSDWLVDVSDDRCTTSRHCASIKHMSYIYSGIISLLIVMTIWAVIITLCLLLLYLNIFSRTTELNWSKLCRVVTLMHFIRILDYFADANFNIIAQVSNVIWLAELHSSVVWNLIWCEWTWDGSLQCPMIFMLIGHSRWLSLHYFDLHRTLRKNILFPL